jgi:luciferase-like monooxygenase
VLNQQPALSHQTSDAGGTMSYMKKLEDELSTWPGISVYPHRFGGREFRLGRAEVGHVHTGGIVDIPFTRAVHDVLLAKGLAQEHRWVPDSGWVTFRMRTEQDLEHALWLFRLSYLRYGLRGASDPRAMLEQESERLHLSGQFRSLLEQHIPANHAPAQALAW